MSPDTHRPRRFRIKHDDIFMGAVTLTGLVVCVGYGVMFAWLVGGGR